MGRNLKGIGRSASIAQAEGVFPSSLVTLPAMWRTWLPQSLLIIAVAGWIYSPAFYGTWIWDDEQYITHNHLIHDPAGYWKVWVNPDGLGDYYPLTAFVEWCEWQQFHNSMLGYHLINIGFHLTGAFLVWRLFAQLGLSLAWVGALLFTIHPIMVESVAWVTELKNTLSLPFLLLAMLAWLSWTKGGSRRFYFWSITWFVVSLLAKTSGLMLPFVFLAHAWWKCSKISWRDLKNVTPFLAVALVAGLVTLFPHHNPGDPQELHSDWSLGAGLAIVGWTIMFLLGKCFLPFPLLPIYPGYSDISSHSALNILPWLGLVGLITCLASIRVIWARHLLFGLCFFLVNLVPVLGYVLSHFSEMVWSMDHLIYLPIIGLIGLAVGGLACLEARLDLTWRMAERMLAAIGFIFMAWSAHAYAEWWINAETLWTRTLQSDPSSWVAEQNLDILLVDLGRPAEAIPYAERVLAGRPDSGDAHFNLGMALEKTGQTAAALAQYREAIKLNPLDGKAYADLANLLESSGNQADAIALFQQAIKCLPDFPQLHYDLGSLWLRNGNFSAAIEELEQAVKLDPELAQARENLGSALAQTGRFPEAIDQFYAAIKIEPDYIIPRYNLARALAQIGRVPEAIEQFQHVLELDPKNALARDNLTRLQQFELQHPAARN
jgi:tetratricopeptide (TPR) repeat protein